MTSLLQIYHHLPAPGRNLVASFRGGQLARWRYGAETNALSAAARDREGWSQEEWEQWQSARLSDVLQGARRDVPRYRRLREWPVDWQSPLNTLSGLPLLLKAELRKSPNELVAEGCRQPLRLESTSGTTGTPLQLRHSRQTAQAWYALVEARWRGWYGLSRQDRWAILGGQLVVPATQNEPPFWVWNAPFNQLYLSSYHLAQSSCAAYLEAIRKSRAVYLLGYASSLYSLALFARQAAIEPPVLKVIISNAEPLYAHQRQLIKQIFHCPVRDTYGMSEMVCGASECEAGTMHLWPDAGIYEVLRDEADEPAAPGEIGRLICTGLLNLDMPLIRYEVGDRVAIAPVGEQCPCGRTLPILRTVEGRCDDVILTPDGRRIGRLDPAFKGDLPILEAQVIQESLTGLRVLVVPGPGFGANHAKLLTNALADRVGGMRIEIETVRTIPRTANGKFRAVISRVKTGNSCPPENYPNVAVATQ